MVDEKFFENSIKVNFTNTTGKVIELGNEIELTHPIYLVPISMSNPYTDKINIGETVRLYLRGKIYKKDQMKSDDKNNFQVLDNNTLTNIELV